MYEDREVWLEGLASRTNRESMSYLGSREYSQYSTLISGNHVRNNDTLLNSMVPVSRGSRTLTAVGSGAMLFHCLKLLVASCGDALAPCSLLSGRYISMCTRYIVVLSSKGQLYAQGRS